MEIGDNVKVKPHPFCLPANKPYIGQIGVIIVISKPGQYHVRFVDDYEGGFFEGKLETDDQAQKEQCVKDCLENKDETKRPFLMAALTLWLWRLSYGN